MDILFWFTKFLFVCPLFAPRLHKVVVIFLPAELLLAGLVPVGHAGGHPCVLILLYQVRKLLSVSQQTAQVGSVELLELCLRLFLSFRFYNRLLILLILTGPE